MIYQVRLHRKEPLGETGGEIPDHMSIFGNDDSNDITQGRLFLQKLRGKIYILYRYTFDSCNGVYYGNTRRHYAVRIFEQLGNSLATGKKYTFNPNNSNNTAVLNHINLSSCIGKEDNLQIIGSAKSDQLLCIKETLIIHQNKPNINTNERSTPIRLYSCLSNYFYYLSILF